MKGRKINVGKLQVITREFIPLFFAIILIV